MKKIIPLILILVFQSFSSFGNPNGKGIICKCVYCNLNHIDLFSYLQNRTPTEIGFIFKDNRVSKYFIKKTSDDIKIKKIINNLTTNEFNTNENEIKWNIGLFNYILNRKTLDLSQKIIGDNGSVSVRNCYVLSESKFLKKMKELSIKYQDEYNQKIKDNKI